MKYVVLFTILFSTLTLAGNDRFDSTDTVLVDGTIADGWFETNTSSRSGWYAEVRAQLQYILGNFNHRNTPGLWHTLKVEFGSAESGIVALYRVRYRATFQLAWTRDTIPSYSEVTVPIRADSQGMKAFEDKYIISCGNSPLWYFFQADCAVDPTDGQKLRIDLKVSDSNTNGKIPDYQRVWQDGKLVVTHILGNTVSRDSLDWHRQLAAQGPSKTTVRTEATYTVTVTDSQTAAGPVTLRTMEITAGNVQSVGQKFKEEFYEYSKDSDVLGYNGHAGLGKNVRAFTNLVRFTPKRYYLVWINACVPFAYLDNALFTKSKAANPGSSWSENLDVLIVSSIGSFDFGHDVRILINVLGERKATYRSFLGSLTSGDPVVIGEQDNPGL